MTIKLLLIPLLVLPTIEDIKTREIRNIHWILIVVLKSLLMIIEKDKEELVKINGKLSVWLDISTPDGYNIMVGLWYPACCD